MDNPLPTPTSYIPTERITFYSIIVYSVASQPIIVLLCDFRLSTHRRLHAREVAAEHVIPSLGEIEERELAYEG